jgi:hypothetical protein
MVSVILMAGYNPISEEHKRIVRVSYREHPSSECYKPLKEFRTRIDSKNFASKPLIQFTMEKLEGVDSVEDIVVVGDKEKLESRLGDFMDSCKKRYVVVDQKGYLSDRILDEFGADRHNFAEGSIAANGLKAYVCSKSYMDGNYALFMASDSPGTSTKTIDDFLAQAKYYAPDSSVVFPVVSKKNMPFWRHAFHRKYIFLVNDDSEHQFDDRFSTFSSIISNKLLSKSRRDGFRVSSMMYVDPSRVDINRINLCYSLRKMLSPEVRDRIRDVLSENDAGDLWRKYFFSKDLSIKDCEDFGSRVLCRGGSRFTILPIPDFASTYDFDDTREDEKGLNHMLRNGIFH